MSLLLTRYFVLVDVKVEKADSHKYVETNGRRTLIARSYNVGYSALELSQKVISFFWQIQAATLNQRTVQRVLLEN